MLNVITNYLMFLDFEEKNYARHRIMNNTIVCIKIAKIHIPIEKNWRMHENDIDEKYMSIQRRVEDWVELL